MKKNVTLLVFRNEMCYLKNCVPLKNLKKRKMVKKLSNLGFFYSYQFLSLKYTEHNLFLS